MLVILSPRINHKMEFVRTVEHRLSERLLSQQEWLPLKEDNVLKSEKSLLFVNEFEKGFLNLF